MSPDQISKIQQRIDAAAALVEEAKNLVVEASKELGAISMAPSKKKYRQPLSVRQQQNLLEKSKSRLVKKPQASHRPRIFNNN